MFLSFAPPRVAMGLVCAVLTLCIPEALIADDADGQSNIQSQEKQTNTSADGSSQDSLQTDLESLQQEVGTQMAESESEPSQSLSGSSSSSTGIQSMNPDISFILDSAFTWYDDKPDLRGGHDPSGIGFNLQGLEMALSADVDPYFRFKSAVVFSLFGVEIGETYGETTSLPYQLQLKAGQFKTNFGRTNPTHMHTWSFVTQPLVLSKFFGGEGLRGMGVELSQLVLPMPGTFRWYLSVQNVSGAATGRSFAPTSSDIKELQDLTATARVEEFVPLSPNWDLLTGLNYAVGRNKTGKDNLTEVFGPDVYLKWRNRTSGGRSLVGWQTELFVRRRQIPDGVLEDFGGYSEVHWRPDRYWGAATRYEYVSGIDPRGEDSSFFGGSILGESGPENVADPMDPNWTRGRHRGAVQLSYYPSHFSRVRLQYSLDHRPYSDDEFSNMVFCQLEFVTGAHGGHAY